MLALRRKPGQGRQRNHQVRDYSAFQGVQQAGPHSTSRCVQPSTCLLENLFASLLILEKSVETQPS
jgi:hypothetical protein